MSNPVKDFFRRFQEGEGSRIERLSERVAEASINSQKHADEYNRVNTFTHLYYLQEEPRQAAYNVYSNMSSYFKGRQGGAASSFSTVSFYNEQAKQKRVTAIQRFKVEAELEAQEAAMAAQAETSEASE